MLAQANSTLIDTPAPVNTPAPVGGPPADVPTILLVEDSASQRRIVHTLLEGAGNWHIVHAVDGLDALKQIELNAPTAVLTDIYMPRMDGLALVEQVRDRYPHIPVVLMTGNGSEQTAVAALKAGAADYVPKLAMVRDLGAILERVLASARAETDKVRLLTGMTGRITRFSIENDPRLVSPLVGQFRDDVLTVGVCDRNGATRIGIALEEAILNAIYHGNLEISSDLKRGGDAPFHALAKERRTQAPYRTRRVRVTARVTPKRASFVITDEGPGFDISRLPDPTDPEYLERPSGRGLLLMRAFMDEVSYNSAGNQVRMVKLKEA